MKLIIMLVLYLSCSIANGLSYDLILQNSSSQCPQPVSLTNGKIVRVTSRAGSTIEALLLNSTIDPDQFSKISIELTGFDQGSITFRYNVGSCEVAPLVVTYRTQDLPHPIVESIPSGYTFQYNPSLGYIFGC
jgi:hypothetical protein